MTSDTSPLAALREHVQSLLAAPSPPAATAEQPSNNGHHHHSPAPLPPVPLRRSNSVVCVHTPEARAALSDVYDELLDLVGLIHPHLYTDVLTPLGSPVMRPSGATASPPAAGPGKDAVPTLLATVQDQRRLVKKAQLDLQVEKGLNTVLRSENKGLKEKLVQIAIATEQEEEALTNKFLVRIEELHKEKAKIIEQVEREEEYITNNLQRKLAQLQREKIDMENQLEQEQESIVNRLQKQLEALRAQQPTTPGSDATASSPLGDHASHRRRGTGSSHTSLHDLTALPPPPSLVDVMRAEIQGLRVKIHELEREVAAKTAQLKAWRDELLVLRPKAGVPTDDLFADSQPSSRHTSRPSTATPTAAGHATTSA
ncbi:hypothetical protein H9P43_007695 [Blastocladiella emersonii ATCC 22665]|nr:hypothetical protein H9P43_007695 [Blastocladiella emersonii ATCC 22665]